MVTVRFSFDADGYIDGYGSDYNDTNAIEIEQSTLDSIAFGATKYINGEFIIDKDKLASLAAANKPQPTLEQQMIAALMAKVTEMEAKNE